MLRGILLFLAGVLAGANGVFYVMTRDGTPRHADGTGAATPTEGWGTSTPPGASASSAPKAASTTAVRTASPGRQSLPQQALPPTVNATSTPVPEGRLLLPVAGMKASDLSDTFNDKRGSDRIHEALDIMAARGTPVLATSDGRVEKLFESKQGGLSLYQFDPTRTFVYYYAHLDRYAPGLVEGKSVRQGELLGYVGSTGNADPTAPHLHFAIFLLGPEKRWWQGTPINPYPLLARG